MPSTYNGIGTRYVGKRRVTSRRGVCQRCGIESELIAYNTRIYFVVFLVPLIPLGRKRIVDQCSTCTYHFMMDADPWEAAKQLGISGAHYVFSTSPTPEHAMDLHQALISFRQNSEAADFRKKVSTQFLDHAKLQASFAQDLVSEGDHAGAVPYFAKALQLRPDLPEARIGVASEHFRNDRLDSARALLDFLEKPGSEHLYSLEPLEFLADGYQRMDQHQAALDLYRRLIEAFPNLAQDKNFRLKVKFSETNLGKTTTILPRKKWSWKSLFKRNSQAANSAPALTWRGLAKFGIAVLLVALSLAGWNEYVRRHRAVYIVSGLNQKATVEVEGFPAMEVFGVIPQKLVLPEGRYRAKVSGAIREEIDFEIKSDYFGRWGDDRSWMINVGGSALLLRQKVRYQSGQDGEAAPDVTVHFGKRFEEIQNVTHPFKELPASVQLKRGRSSVLTDLNLWKAPVASLMNNLTLKQRYEEALALAEWHLAFHPEDESILDTYFAMGAHTKQMARVDKLLESRIEIQPVHIGWHRRYQGGLRSHERDLKLIGIYDTMLTQNPNDAAVLYLRGRIETDSKRKLSFFEKADAIDPKIGFPAFAMACDRASQAKWKEARKFMEKAISARPTEEQFQDFMFQIRLALGEAADLEKEAREILKKRPVYQTAAGNRIDALVSQNRAKEAAKAAAEFEQSAQRHGEAGIRVGRYIRWYHYYATGNFTKLAEECQREVTDDAKHFLAQALIEQGKVADALKVFPFDHIPQTAFSHYLGAALAAQLANDPSQAILLEERALSILEAGDNEEALVAKLLRNPAISVQELTEASFRPNQKALAAAYLAVKYPVKRKEFVSLATKLNISFSYPRHLITKATRKP